MAALHFVGNITPGGAWLRDLQIFCYLLFKRSDGLRWRLW
jgi:hypothetical protein